MDQLTPDTSLIGDWIVDLQLGRWHYRTGGLIRGYVDNLVDGTFGVYIYKLGPALRYSMTYTSLEEAQRAFEVIMALAVFSGALARAGRGATWNWTS